MAAPLRARNGGRPARRGPGHHHERHRRPDSAPPHPPVPARGCTPPRHSQDRRQAAASRGRITPRPHPHDALRRANGPGCSRPAGTVRRLVLRSAPARRLEERPEPDRCPRRAQRRAPPRPPSHPAQGRSHRRRQRRQARPRRGGAPSLLQLTHSRALADAAWVWAITSRRPGSSCSGALLRQRRALGGPSSSDHHPARMLAPDPRRLPPPASVVSGGGLDAPVMAARFRPHACTVLVCLAALAHRFLPTPPRTRSAGGLADGRPARARHADTSTIPGLTRSRPAKNPAISSRLRNTAGALAVRYASWMAAMTAGAVPSLLICETARKLPGAMSERNAVTLPCGSSSPGMKCRTATNRTPTGRPKSIVFHRSSCLKICPGQRISPCRTAIPSRSPASKARLCEVTIGSLSTYTTRGLSTRAAAISWTLGEVGKPVPRSMNCATPWLAM